MSTEIVLNVSDLPPPEPFERIVTTLNSLAPDAHLRVLHRREPLPLYPWLEEHGFRWRTQRGASTEYEILIWRSTLAAPP